MLVDVVPRWSVLAFATAHVLGLLIHHPVPWTGSLTAVSLLLVAAAAMVRAATGPLRGALLVAGLTAAAGLVARVEWRGGGIGWPFFLTRSPDGGVDAWVEASLITVTVAGLSATALLPEHGTEDRLRALRGRLEARLQAWYAERRTNVADLLAPPPEPDAGADRRADPVVLDLGVLEPHRTTPAGADRDGRQRRARSLPRSATIGTVLVTASAVGAAAWPMWWPDFFDQIPVVDARDRAGMLLATVPVLFAVAAATVAVCRGLRAPSRTWGTAMAAAAFVALAVPVAWERGGDPRFSPDPPPTVLVLHSYRYVETAPRQGDLPPAQIHPGIIEAARATEPAPHDAVLAAAGLLTLVALTAVLLPARARRPEPLR